MAKKKQLKLTQNQLILSLMLIILLISSIAFVAGFGAINIGRGSEPLAPTRCADSDDGSNYQTKGTVEYLEEPLPVQYFTDRCLRGSILMEYSCDDNRVESVEYDCVLEGSSCSDGACASITHCEETDDGINKFEKGTAIFKLPDLPPEYYTDRCEDSTQLKEYYCNQNILEEIVIDCVSSRDKTTKCIQGVCV
ncbi:MAG: hypothetical protein ABIF08_01390 [Nanoarchaeota archaeon]